ncbi:hypothetical protein [Roseibium sp. Sym1]|uniref:hypothetical protein n=1 Tax=Roseibium sp. Sym1 TaxID=3016006 RepID=UPI0022B3F1F8|nr:hypothetical protein [Roseibium sp. Sym1]
MLVAGLVLPVLCGLVFFWPEGTIPNVDDLFFVPWAMEVAETGRHWNSLLAVQFPGLENYHLQPRLHLILSGWFFAGVGAETATLVLYEFLCYALTSLAFVLVCLKLNLRLAALFTPLLFAPMYTVAGFRLELTGSLIFMVALLVSVPLLIRAVIGVRFGTSLETAGSIFGKALFGIAPLAAPALFAWSLGTIAVIEIWRLASRQASLVRVMAEGVAALVIALAVFAVSADFEFTEFLEQFTYHASRSTGGGINDEALVRAIAFAAVSGVLVWRKARVPAALCLALAAGQAIGAFLHDKALIRNLAASMVFLVAMDAVLARRWNRLKAAAALLLVLVLSVNFISFRIFSEDAGNLDAVLSTYRQDLESGGRVFIDEVMAQHYLDQQTDGALAWTWGGTFPKGRPTGINDIKDGDVWYVSEYTLLGYLKGRHDIAERVWPEPDYRHVPQIPCLLGRQSCNLPQRRWTMLRLERNGDNVMVEDLGAENSRRPVPTH